MNKSEATVPMADQPKQGGKCCGSCCDYRKAVIILAIIEIILQTVGLALSGQNPDYQIEDDDLNQELNTLTDDLNDNQKIFSYVSYATAFLSLLGAFMYNKYMLAIPVIWSIVSYALSLIAALEWKSDMFDLLDERVVDDVVDSSAAYDDAERVITFFTLIGFSVGAVILCLWIYPSIFLMKEIHQGIMTKETYPREEYSCCCSARRR